MPNYNISWAGSAIEYGLNHGLKPNIAAKQIWDIIYRYHLAGHHLRAHRTGIYPQITQIQSIHIDNSGFFSYFE